MDKFDIQDEQYVFPYHHIPCLRRDGSVVRTRILKWGFEYLCYQLHARDIVAELNPNSILDVGCGDGRFLHLLREIPGRKVGIDLSAKAIGFAKAFTPEAEFVVTDVAALPGTFDLVTAMEVLEHIPDSLVQQFLSAVESRISPLGRLLVTVPTKALALNPKHYRHYDLALLGEQIGRACPTLHFQSADFIYRTDFIINIYQAITTNRIWSGEINLLRKFVWNRVWNKLRRATPSTGRHLVAVYQKMAKV